MAICSWFDFWPARPAREQLAQVPLDVSALESRISCAHSDTWDLRKFAWLSRLRGVERPLWREDTCCCAIMRRLHSSCRACERALWRRERPEQLMHLCLHCLSATSRFSLGRSLTFQARGGCQRPALLRHLSRSICASTCCSSSMRECASSAARARQVLPVFDVGTCEMTLWG